MDHYNTSMTTSIFFATPGDTAIAAPDTAFIEALRVECRNFPSLEAVSSAHNADIVLIDERYEYRTWRYRDELLRCKFLRRHAERLCVINHDSYARVFLPGLYSSLSASRPPLVDASSAPYKRDLWQIPVPGEHNFATEKLFAFRGTFHTHGIRRKICRALQASPQGSFEELRKAFHSHDAMDQRVYIDEICSAAFSLCPRGLSPSSYRLYESMQLGRAPVVVSDAWIPPDGPDWDNFVIRVPEADTAQLLKLLQDRQHEAMILGRQAREAWEEFFSWPARYHTFLRLVLSLRQQQNQWRNMDELAEIWHSAPFHRLYDWTLGGRLRQRLSRLVRRPGP